MKTILTATTAFSLVIAMAAMAPAQTMETPGMSSGMSSDLSLTDRHFITKAAMGGMAEVEAGNMAVEKGGAAVKMIGNKMVADHTAVNDKLMKLAQGDGVMPPTTLDAKHQAMATALAGKTGAAFDSYYLSTEKMGHIETIALFKHEAAYGHDTDLKALASQTLPTLEEHLEMIEKAQ